MLAVPYGRAVRPLPVAVTVGALALLLPVVVAILNQRGMSVTWPWLGFLCVLAGFWMTRATSFLKGVGFAAGCGATVAVVGMLARVQLAGTATLASPLSLVVVLSVIGGVFGVVGGTMALVLARLHRA